MHGCFSRSAILVTYGIGERIVAGVTCVRRIGEGIVIVLNNNAIGGLCKTGKDKRIALRVEVIGEKERI